MCSLRAIPIPLLAIVSRKILRLLLAEIAPGDFTLSGTPADCVRVALTAVFEDIDWVFSGINRGGNLGSDLFTSGTVAAAREAAFLGKPAIAISQYIKKGVRSNGNVRKNWRGLSWRNCSRKAASTKNYWNVNLPHTQNGELAATVVLRSR